MNKTWLVSQAEALREMKESKLAQEIGIEDVYTDTVGAVFFVVRNDTKEDWKDDDGLKNYLSSIIPSGHPRSSDSFNLRYGGWLLAPREDTLFVPGANVEVQCMWAAEPTFYDDPLCLENEAANRLIHLEPDILFGWCPGRVMALEGNTVQVELARRIFMEQIGSNNIQVGKQSRQIRVVLSGDIIKA